MKRFTITASEVAIYEIEIDAKTKEEAMEHFYENMSWLEPMDYINFQVDGVTEREIEDEKV
jgi:hypothetical protein